MIGAFALTEADAGSDASAIRTRAVRVSGGWRLNGSKQFMTSGRIAGVAVIFAITNSAANKMGQGTSDTCALRLEDMFVEDALLFGFEGDSYRITLSNLEAGRVGIAAHR